ncbi:hypothetical protein [Streptomyces sp. NPDC050507]|uniref:hypothetical protein n=1 Tax=Streptomyces sp. NPDC050507 TaxID=3365619 RepID=UPI0037B2A7CE
MPKKGAVLPWRATVRFEDGKKFSNAFATEAEALSAKANAEKVAAQRGVEVTVGIMKRRDVRLAEKGRGGYAVDWSNPGAPSIVHVAKGQEEWWPVTYATFAGAKREIAERMERIIHNANAILASTRALRVADVRR